MITREEIEAEYQRRLAACTGHPRWGWSFMYTPEKAIETAKLVLAGLNPGGEQIDEPPDWEHAGVNAYVDESWRGLPPGEHHLQSQVRSLFDAAGVRPGEVFAANLVPFRSPSWSKLPDRAGALAFGRRLWDDLLPRTPARLFITLGKQPAQELAERLQAKYQRSHDVNWRPQFIDEYLAADGRTLLALPHLSRFTLFSEGRSEARVVVGDVARRVTA